MHSDVIAEVSGLCRAAAAAKAYRTAKIGSVGGSFTGMGDFLVTDEDYRLFGSAGYRGSAYVKKFSPEDIGSSVHYFMHISIPPEKIEQLITDIITDESCGRIFRIKGSLPVENGWLKINATRERTETAVIPEGQPVLIVIGDGVSRQRIDQYLIPLNTDPEYVSI